MARRWTVAVLLAIAGTAQAQYPSPGGVPVPTMLPSRLPDGAPMGPMTPLLAAQAATAGAGQPMAVAPSAIPAHNHAAAGVSQPRYSAPSESPLSLSGQGLNAWNDDGYSTRVDGCYASVGFMALFRPDLGHSVLAFRDPTRTDDLPDQPSRFAPLAIDFHDMDPRPLYGLRGTFGYRYETLALEFTGFYMHHDQTSRTAIEPGRLAVPFSAFLPPPGFEGNNNLWLNADRVEARYHAAFGNVELNYRRAALGGIDCIVGVRYVDYKDFFGVLTDDDNLTFTFNPLNVADYRVTSHSHFIAPQLGFECAHHCCSDSVAVGLIAKGAWGINFVDVNVDLERGDNFRQSGRRSEAVFGQVYELGVFSDCYCCDQVKVRIGYQMFLLSNFPQAHEQLDFNIRANPTGQRRDQSLILYHGPMIELAVQF